MVQPRLEQHAYNANCRRESRTLTATFERVTGPGALITMVIVTGGGGLTSVQVPSGFTLIRSVQAGRLCVYVYYYQNAPSMDSAAITLGDDRSIQLRLKEYSHVAQSNALDQVSVRSSTTERCHSGYTAVTAQADELVISVVANSYTSCAQYGFLGGLIRLFESLSPAKHGGWFNIFEDDSDRTRCTIHHSIVILTGIFWISCFLSSSRDWIAIVCSFRGGSSGPKQLTSKNQTAPVMLTGAKTSVLYVFGPLKSTSAVPVIKDSGLRADMFPFNYQYRVGVNSMLIGSGTMFRVEQTDGLYGHEVRVSDIDLPRDPGALRGIDLESARIVQFTMNVGRGKDLVELNMQALMRAMVPQRDEDWPLIWRHPNGPVRMMMCRPLSTLRTRDRTSLQGQKQTFALRASDPHHYAAAPKSVIIPNTPKNASPVYTQVTNEGDIPAYPVITIIVPGGASTVTRVTLTNLTAQVIFDVILNIPPRSALVGDMLSRVTSSSVKSSVTLDGSSRYGAWKLPRDPFRIDPDPLGMNGYNLIALATEPAGATIQCLLDYRDTWAG